MRTCFPFLMASLGLVTSFAATASAHIRLLSPAPRYEVQGEVGIKSCPCGLGGSNRVCDVARDGSDDDRSTRVTGGIYAGDAVIDAFASVGWRWGGYWSGSKDYQHFSANGR